MSLRSSGYLRARSAILRSRWVNGAGNSAPSRSKTLASSGAEFTGRIVKAMIGVYYVSFRNSIQL